jgi:hypothetical protein
MDVCEICSRPFENGKYCKRCKLQKHTKYVEPIEKIGHFIKDKIVPAGIAIILTALVNKLKDSSSGDTA